MKEEMSNNSDPKEQSDSKETNRSLNSQAANGNASGRDGQQEGSDEYDSYNPWS